MTMIKKSAALKVTEVSKKAPRNLPAKAVAKIKTSSCVVCKAPFTKNRPLQRVCSWFCAKAWARVKSEKLEKQRIKLAKERLKTKAQLLKEAQKASNAYIRMRDAGKQCICCNEPLALGDPRLSTGGSYDCGHYRSIGSAPHLRFDERNAHGQRKQCNRWGAGRAVDYRVGLIARIGIDAVEDLEGNHLAKKWTLGEIRELIAMYKAMYKAKQKTYLKVAAAHGTEASQMPNQPGVMAGDGDGA